MHRLKNSRQILNLGRRSAARWPEQHNPGGPHLSGKAQFLKMVTSQNKRFGTYPAPTERDHGVPEGGDGAASGASQHAADWAAATAQTLGPTRIATLYAAYVAARQKQKKPVRSQAEWWGLPGQRGGARHTVGGCLGEYQADKLFAAQGHAKLNHGGQLVGLLAPPRGKGLDGVWRNATPPPEYFITETKYGNPPKLTKATNQMSNEWVFGGNRLARAVDNEEEVDRITMARANGQVERRVLHIDYEGNLTQYRINKASHLNII